MATRMLIIALLLCFTATAGAQSASESYQAEVTASLDNASERLLSLAEAVPEELYDWRPEEGVRSFQEVFMHVASSSYFMAERLGIPSPEGAEGVDLEGTVTEKEEVIVELERALTHLRGAVENLEEDDLEQTVTLWGGMESTKRGVLLQMTRHTGEHLGQLVAYSRVNGIVPPWSQ